MTRWVVLVLTSDSLVIGAARLIPAATRIVLGRPTRSGGITIARVELMPKKRNLSNIAAGCAGLIATFVLLLHLQISSAKDTPSPTGVIEGTVKSPRGEALYGILVKASGEGQNYQTSVFTDENGRYEFPPLPRGQYRVSAGTVRQESVVLKSANATQDLTVDLNLELLNQTTGASWVKAFPGTDDEKTRFSVSCGGGCHGIPAIINKSPRSAQRWADAMKQMAYVNVEGNPLPTDQPPRIDLSPKNVEIVTEYLARIIQPGVIEKSIGDAIVRPKGASAKAVFVEWETDWDVPEEDRFYFPRSSYSWLDPAGMIWFVWHNGATGADGIGRVNPRTNEIRKWTYPNGQSLLHDVMGDKDGNIWTNASNLDRLLRFDPRKEEFKEWNLHTTVGRRPHTGDLDPQGNYWVTLNVSLPSGPGYGAVAKLDPRTGEISEYPTKTKHPGNYGLAADAKGNVWFAELGASKLAKADAAGNVTEYDPPTAHSGVRRVRIDSQGHVWFTEYYADKIGVLDPGTNNITEYPLGTDYNSSQPYAIHIDRSGKVWFSLTSGNSLGRLDPATKQIDFFLLPSGSYARDVWPDYSTNHFAVTYGVAERPLVGRMYLR